MLSFKSCPFPNFGITVISYVGAGFHEVLIPKACKINNALGASAEPKKLGDVSEVEEGLQKNVQMTFLREGGGAPKEYP